MCRFGIPQSIVTDNGSKFDNRVYGNFYSELKIKNLYSTPRYPQSNDQVEASNKTLLSALKKRLHLAKRKWVEELPRVLWAYKTTSWKPMGESPIEIRIPTIQTKIPGESSIKAIIKNLDMTNELREVPIVRITSYQQRLTSLHNRRVRLRIFKVGELVLRRVFENTYNPVDKKFQLNWEEPYTVVRVGPVGSYALSKPEETTVPKMWNATHLKKYYQ